MGRHIAILSRYGMSGPSSRLRLYQYIPALQAAGARVTVHPLLDDTYVERYFASGQKSRGRILAAYARRVIAILRQKPDLIWVEKEVFPYLPAAFELLLRVRGIRYVVDYDDAVFHNYDLSRSPLVRRILGNKLAPLLSGAALVTAGNAYLADYARDHGARAVLDVPTVVDLDDYRVMDPPADGQIRIGWIGTPNNAPYLAPVIAALDTLKDRFPLRLLTIGAGDLENVTVPHDQLPWSLDTQSADLGRVAIGVMPLIDSPWERGKCGFKLIQYMAAERPVIASPVGVNSVIVTPDVGLLVSAGDWANAIAALAGDPSARKTMGQAARRRVAEHYSLALTAPRIVDAFADIVSTAS